MNIGRVCVLVCVCVSVNVFEDGIQTLNISEEDWNSQDAISIRSSQEEQGAATWECLRMKIKKCDFFRVYLPVIKNSFVFREQLKELFYS